MKLFFKHLARSIVKKPLQPFVLVLTLTLAIATSIFSFVMRDSLTQEIALKQAAQYGNAQITVTLNGTSKSRFMFEEDAQKLLGDTAEVSGTFEVPMFFGTEKQTVFSVATDFYTVGNTFELAFSEYGKITPSTVSSAALISEEFAEAQSLAIGDIFQAEVFGGIKEYKVCGVSPNKFLGSCDIMVDITGVVRLMAKDSPLISALGDAFKPCSVIYVHVYDQANVDACLKLLSESETFSDKNVADVSGEVMERSYTGNLMSVIDVSVLLTSLLAAAVAFCCFYILAAERAAENYTFTLSGARAWMLNALQYAEIIAYWLLSSVVGVSLVPLLVKGLFPYVGFQYASGAIGVWNVVKGTAFLLGVSLATVTLFIFAQSSKTKKSGEKHLGRKGVLLVLGITVLVYTAVFLVPMSWRFVAYMVATVGVLFSLFVIVPPLLGRVMKKRIAAQEKRFYENFRLKNTALRYARKNLYSVKILHNVSRLVAVLTCILVTSGVVVGCAYGNVAYTQEFFTADYVVMNATESCVQKVESCENIQGCYKVLFEVSSEGNFVSTTHLDALSETRDIKNKPQGDQAVMGKAEAIRKGLKIGDRFKVEVSGQEVELVLTEIVPTGLAYILFDCEYFDIPYTLLMVKGADGTEKSEVLEELTEKTAMELAVIASVDSVFQDKTETMDIFLRLGLLLLLMLVLFSVIGMADTLYESYRARKEEFSLYQTSGMSKRTARCIIFWEISITIAFGIGLGLLAFIPSLLALQTSFYQFAFDLMINFIKIF